MIKSKDRQKVQKSKSNILPKFTLFFFNRPRLTAILWLIVFSFGIFSYTTLLKREGFPSVEIPIASISGTYIVNDSKLVDQKLAQPISELAKEQKEVSSVRSQSFDNFFTVIIQYKEGVNSQEATDNIEKKIQEELELPQQAELKFAVPKFGVTGGAAKQIDLTISFYDSKGDKSTQDLTNQAEIFASKMREQQLSNVEEVFVQSPFELAINPITNTTQSLQKSFDRFGERQDDENNFYNSVIIGITAKSGTDVIKLDDQVRKYISEQSFNDDYMATISASFAPAIEDNLEELQRVLLEGLIAVLIVGSLVIAVRASIITVVSMLTVLAATFAVLLLAGYSLNVITLFAIIISLSLIVDDTIIMVEAIDAQRKRRKDPKLAVEQATKKVSKAMISATSTAALSFAPLIFVTGVLGGFIRAMPITIISALIISLIVALVFIPFFARFLLLGKKQMGDNNVKELAAGFESKIANFIAIPMQWAKGSYKKLLTVGLVAVFIGLGFIAAGGYIAKDVAFNIFPPSKDANDLEVNLTFKSGQNIDQVQLVADNANEIVANTLGSNFVQATNYGLANTQQAPLNVEIISYNSREESSAQLVDKLKQAFNGFENAEVSVRQVDAGPPASPFTVIVTSDDRKNSLLLANDIAKYLEGRELKRPNGEIAKISSVSVSSPAVYSRTDGLVGISVTASFDGDDISTLVNIAKVDINNYFNDDRLSLYGLRNNDLKYDFGQESENQDSFQALTIAFPILLLVIYIVLAFQFRSLLQPLLIFMALPFSFFGIALGLYLTDNSFSFFAMLGFFALIGLSIKNTILLTDYANQARQAGMGSVDAATVALKERFRPLVATSLTAVVSLIPLALQSPFWQGLAVVLIFGLLSSTLLVLTVFPYYYLGAEFMRMHINKTKAILWTISLIASVFIVSRFIALIFSLVIIIIWFIVGALYLYKSTKNNIS